MIIVINTNNTILEYIELKVKHEHEVIEICDGNYTH